MGELRDKQVRFVWLIGDLIKYARELGYELTFGHAWRSPSCMIGQPWSNHRKRLAVDFNLFKNGVWLTDGTGHDVLHDYWDTKGGAPRIPDDLNHYSLEYDGII